MKMEGIAFDLEGTIVDLESFHHNAHIQTAKNFGIDISIDWSIAKLDHFVGGPDIAVAQDIADHFPNRFSILEFATMKEELFKKAIRNIDMKVREGFYPFFEKVVDAKLEVAIGTNTNLKFAIELVDSCGLAEHISDEWIVSINKNLEPKPAPDVYLATAAAMKVDPKSQLVFEDSIVGVRAATSAGSKVVALPTIQDADYEQQLFEAGASRVFRSWKELESLQDLNSLYE